MPELVCDTSVLQYLHQLQLDAKQIGAVSAVAPLLDRLEALGFHLTEQTRQMVLQRANEHTKND